MPHGRDITRRTFIGGTAAGLTILSARALGAKDPDKKPKKPAKPKGISLKKKLPPNERLNIACVGCGGKGKSDVAAVTNHNIVALCDVDDKEAASVYMALPDVPKYRDYRVMLDKHANEIDAVTVSTPDHMHAPIAMKAIRMGKHVFVQKPLTHDVYEARMLAEAARKYKVATQMGNQGHSGEGIRLACEWIWAGIIGDVKEVHCWTNRPIWPQGMERPTGSDPVPSTLSWDPWLGVAPKRPYRGTRGMPEAERKKGRGWYQPFTWRGWWDFGCGALGDMGCHIMDATFWALKLGYPTSVESESSPFTAEAAPKSSIVTYKFPARGKMPPVTVKWFDGKNKPPRPKDAEGVKTASSGMFFLGEKGVIYADTYCGGPRIIPETKMKELLPKSKRPAKTIPRSKGHVEDWIIACKGGKPASSNFDYAGPFTEVVLLGNLAIRAGNKKLLWDGPNMKVTNVPEANKFVRNEYRKGWTL